MNDQGGADPAAPTNALIDTFVALLQVAGFGLGAAGASAAAQLDMLRQRSMATERPSLLTPGEIAEAIRRSAVTPAQVENTLTRLGYSGMAQAVLGAMVETLPDLGSLVALRRREVLSPGEYAQRSAELGYVPDVAEALYRLSEYVPPAQDVVQFAVREAFTPEIAERFGQNEDFPTEALPFFARAGVNEADAKRYWASHWVLPSIQMVFEMYHRRAETGTTLDDVRLLLRAQDVMPFWREKIIQVATSPYTRVDVRRMHKLGILSEAEVTQAYQEVGYSDERAKNLTKFTVQANAQESDDALEPFRSGLRSKTLSMYQARTMPEADTREALDNLGYTAEQIEAYITEAAFIRAADEADDWRAAIQKNYVQGFWNREQVITKMVDLGFSDPEVIDLVTVWDVQRELRVATLEERSQKELTKAEIVSAYREGLLSETEARDDLRDLGYDDDEAEMVLRLADAANAKATRADVEAGTRALYVAGRIGEGDARSRLGASGITSARVEALVGKWQDEIKARTPTLSVAQVQRALKLSLIDDADADRRLTAIGYQQEDRAILITLAGESTSAEG